MATYYLDMPQEVDPVEDHINQFFDRVVACVEDRRQTLLAEAQEKRLAKAARPTVRVQKQEELISAKADLERNIQNYELKEMQERFLAEIELNLSELRLPLPETHLVFRGYFEQLEQLILNAGKVREEEIPVMPRYQEMRKVVEGSKKGELTTPRSIAIDENSNYIYVSDWDDSRLSIFSESGEFLYTLTHERMRRPYGIAIQRNNMYVTDRMVQGVFKFKFKSDLRLIAVIGGHGAADGKFNDPRQIAVSVNGEIFVADYGNHRVQILNESLHFKRSIKHESMIHPHDIKVTYDEVFVLAVGSSPCIIVFTHAGEKLRSLITMGEGMQMTNPWFFCIDGYKNLIFTDYISSCVKIFSPDGSIIHTMGELAKLAQNPCLESVALTKQLKMVLIVRNAPFQLQIFA